MAPKIITYRHIPEGWGGTFPSNASTPMIGTRNYITCVGIYFLIGNGTVFAAHVNASIQPSDWSSYIADHPSAGQPDVCEGDEGDALQEKVLVRLQQTARDGNWDPENIDRSKIILTCSEYNGHPIVGKFVVKAIKQFFRMEEDPHVHDQCHGFTVDATGDDPILMPWNGFADWADSMVEVKNRWWSQRIDGQLHYFRAGDLTKNDGLEEWKFTASPELQVWCIVVEKQAGEYDCISTSPYLICFRMHCFGEVVAEPQRSRLFALPSKTKPMFAVRTGDDPDLPVTLPSAVFKFLDPENSYEDLNTPPYLRRSRRRFPAFFVNHQRHQNTKLHYHLPWIIRPRSQSRSQTSYTQSTNLTKGIGKVISLSSLIKSHLPFGTRNCRSCVGLFLPLPLPTNNSSYVAHINARVLCKSKDDHGEKKYNRVASASEVAQIKAIALTRLHAIFAKNDWAKDAVDIPRIALICIWVDIAGGVGQATGCRSLDSGKCGISEERSAPRSSVRWSMRKPREDSTGLPCLEQSAVLLNGCLLTRYRSAALLRHGEFTATQAMHPSPEPQTITYRNTPEGFGIDGTRCHLAHINATIQIQDSRNSLRRVQGDEGRRLERLVLSKLRHAAREGCWKPNEIDPSNIVVVCPRPDDSLTGYYVINAIATFFDGRGVPWLCNPSREREAVHAAREGFDRADPSDKVWVQEVQDRPYRFVAEEEEEGFARDDWAPEVTRA
ncbi:hypothetical protein DOTSEDRAFT_77344 [Dothistroma septosporum NZE10]|uniref:Uncharacterized protein n=1 Tax=Dothistroma septosporum (strain NZE10 / CBS 128990) TaxID=675120 RepID=N1Q4K4_DOTSN|nr:hypothetical protein DOTSEDRAFT_77344 [Dothistroma septosporum NZE10]